MSSDDRVKQHKNRIVIVALIVLAVVSASAFVITLPSIIGFIEYSFQYPHWVERDVGTIALVTCVIFVVYALSIWRNE